MTNVQEVAVGTVADGAIVKGMGRYSKASKRRLAKQGGDAALQNDSAWFLLPSGLILGLVMIAPLLFAIYLSLFSYFLGQDKTFVWFSNYASLLGDARFWWSLIRTVCIVFSAVLLEFCSGLLIAYGLYNLSSGARFFNVLIMLPNIITPVVSGVFLRWVFVPDYGLIDVALNTIGIVGPDFLSTPFWARITIVLADMWQFTPFMVLVLFAGLNTVDRSQIEAAQIDGVGSFGMLLRIMLPNIKPLIVFVLAIRLMDSFRFFDQIFILTSGGPGTATETLTMFTYSLGFNLLNIGAASALGVMTLAIELLVVLLMIRLVYRKEKGAF
ncbi:carbohydrate ABC transporter permease [Bradyrhizobium sp. JYMT SZCCT0428]|uniref:carbohydrate ABC transporter permease n=1 Tax=Bradyrhizobium sp. JYMT SZCCT0428 TaxID=2807673 RepID=UPI001BAB3B7A|nr:sugar ABC transporter permease [Bradyrhizobium sp. JYMT SZCCT0428]MBR1149430.1 sugar ABC transporter permease [Bradyrhizobium sp. JYMT SZCCT0428]